MAKKNARNTRGRIVNAAWKLFYEQGYEDTTVEEIIDLSKTSKGSFYHYFDGKDALLSTLSTLFDEKITGSLHFTPGNAYAKADNGNRSTIHWDLILIQRPEHGGGEVWFDGELIRKDGLFIPADLANLNP